MSLSVEERRRRLLQAGPDSALARRHPALYQAGRGTLVREGDRLAAFCGQGTVSVEPVPADLLRITPMLKPAGDDCNLSCRYCTTRASKPTGQRMGRDLLERIVREILPRSPQCVDFIFHGGEPLLAGLDFFRAALELQARHARSGQKVRNHVQTNGTQIDAVWARFFAETDFFVGVSLDGPESAHDSHRINADGRGTHARILAGVRHMLSAGVRLQAIAVVPPRPTVPAADLLAFMQETGISNWRVNFCRTTESIATYPAYADELFRAWTRQSDVCTIGIVSETIAGLLGYAPVSCWMNGSCRRFIGFEPDGTVAPYCEMPVDAEYAFGNLREHSLPELLSSPSARRFEESLRKGRSACSGCVWAGLCGGGCAYARLSLAGSPEAPDPLCPLYRETFRRLSATFDAILENGPGGPNLPLPFDAHPVAS